MEDAKRIACDAWDKILTLGQVQVSLMSEASSQIQDAQQASQSGAPISCMEGCGRGSGQGARKARVKDDSGFRSDPGDRALLESTLQRVIQDGRVKSRFQRSQSA